VKRRARAPPASPGRKPAGPEHAAARFDQDDDRGSPRARGRGPSRTARTTIEDPHELTAEDLRGRPGRRSRIPTSSRPRTFEDGQDDDRGPVRARGRRPPIFFPRRLNGNPEPKNNAQEGPGGATFDGPRPPARPPGPGISHQDPAGQKKGPWLDPGAPNSARSDT